MTFDIDPRFQGTGRKSKTRARKRLAVKLGIGGGIAAGVLGVVALVALMIFGGDDTPGDVVAETPEVSAEGDEFALVQSEAATRTGIEFDNRESLIHLQRDPMILVIEDSDTSDVTSVEGPDTLPPERVGPQRPGRIEIYQDVLFVAERQLVTRLPSSREDFAYFQATRGQGIEELQAMPVARQVAEAGEVVAIEEDSSWGSFIANDTDADPATQTDEAAVYVETQIENTTSVALALRENQRFGLFEDVVVVLRADRDLGEVLRSNGMPAANAERVTTAVSRELEMTEQTLTRGSVVALRFRPGPAGRELLQMSLYGPDGYIATLAQVGAGRFSRGSDPWLLDNLMDRSGSLRQEALAQGDVRLLDALYSAAIRNGMSTELVGEMIVAMSKQHDLESFVSEEDKVTFVKAREPGPAGTGLGALLYVGITGSSEDMICYVVPVEEGGFACLNRRGSSVAGGLSGGLLVPVQGVRTSGYGPRHHPILKQVRNHDGVDWAAPTGTPIVAAADGTIALAGVGGGYGNVVYIDHPGGIQTRYAHLDSFADTTSNGVAVRAGDVIGFVGTTGRSTGPHLHFEVRVNGAAVDPMTFSGGGATASGAVEVLVNKIIQVESGGNASAKNPLSSATGLGQFIDSTWIYMMKRYRPDLVNSMSQADLLALRNDPALSREMVTNLARENESFLRGRGHDITPGRLYLAHFLGPADAHKVIAAVQTTPIENIVAPGVISANGFLAGMSAAGVQAWSDGKMSGSSGRAVVVQAALSPEERALKDAVDEVLGGG
ncbi:MAG: peptidoglycan DD-metalloendopeptidase family protein [Pseudomonadota bacterium]|nr:peptidoglycan DD-metalloendopeptidase family protein [Pseudomonadota bacterium]